MKKLMVAIAGAVALTCSAFAEQTSWFSGGITADWPNATGMNGAWSNTDDSVYENNALSVSATDEAPLTFKATNAKTLGDTAKTLVFSSNVNFTPFDKVPDVPTDAKAGVIVLKTVGQGFEKLEYYVLQANGGRTANEWAQFDQKKNVGEADKIDMIVQLDGDNNPTVKYIFNDDEDSASVVPIYLPDSTFQSVKYVGDGVVASLAGAYEANLVEFTIASIANTDVIAVSNNNVALTAPYKAAKDSEVTVVYQAKPGYFFEGGATTKIGTGTAAAGPISTDVTAEDVVEAEAKISTQFYLTFNAAFNAAVDGDTITLCKDANAAKITLNEGKFATGLTLNLNSKTLTFNSGSDDAIQVLMTNNLTIAHGTITTEDVNFRDIIRFYNKDDKTLTLDNVTLDGSNLENGTTSKAHSVLTIEGGNCQINSGSEIVAPDDANDNEFYAIKLGNHADAKYTVGTLTVDCQVQGDILLTGGKYVEGGSANVMGKYYYGKNAHSVWADDSDVFEARTGVLPATGAEDNYVGKLYKQIADAINDLDDGDTLALCKNIADSQMKFEDDVAVTLDLNGKTFCCATPKDPNNWYGFTIRVYKGTLTIVDSVGGGKVVNTNDDSAIRCCAAGDDFESEPKVIINGGIFENCSQAESTIYAGAGTAQNGTIVINSATVSNTYDGAFEYPNASRILNVGNANPAGYAAIQVKGGTYQLDPSLGDDNLGGSYLPAGYYSYKVGENWEVKNQAPAAKIGTAIYLTLNDAFDAATAGDTITLLADVTEAIDNTNTASFTLNLNGKTISSDATATIKQNAVGSTLTIVDGATGGKVLNTANAMDMGIAIWARQGSIVVEAGYFENASQYEATAYVGAGTAQQAGSTISINGGTFVNKLTYQWNPNGYGTLNVWNSFTDTSAIKVYGGTFSTDPAKGDDSLGGTFVAANYVSTKVGDLWTVAPAAAKIGDVFYLTLNEALDAAKAGETVTLCADITTDAAAAFVINKNITLDFATFTVTKTVANDWMFDIPTGVTVVFTGTEGGATQTASNLNPTSPASMIRNKGNLTINGGVYTSDFCIIKNDEDPGAGVLTVNGGTFTVVEAAEGFKDQQWALMNWATATINGGTWNGVIGTRSSDANKVSKAGATEVTAFGEDTSVEWLLQVGYAGDTTYENLPKVKADGMLSKGDILIGKAASLSEVEFEVVDAGNSWFTVQKKVTGPTPAPGSETKVDPVPGKENTYEVTPTGTSTEVAIAGVKSGDTIVVDGSKVDSIGLNTAEGVTVKVMNKGYTADISAACKGWDGNKFDATLNPEGIVDVKGEKIPVTPTAVEASEGTIADGAVATKAIPGLTYTLKRGTELGTYKTAVDSEVAAGTTVSLKDSTTDKPAAKAFYVIEVTK